MIPPTSIDGTDITGATIDGTDVQEITVDGQTVFTAETLPVGYSNLVAWYPFDSANYGGSNADDVTAILGGSGDDTAYDGTVNGPSYVSNGGVTDIEAGVNSGAFDFGGHINTTGPSGLGGSASKTLSLWINSASVGSFQVLTALTGPGRSDENVFGFFYNSGPSIFFYGFSTADIVFNHTPVANVWEHYAITYDGSTVKGYFNGAQDFSVAQSLNTFNDEFYIGGRQGGENELSDANVDDVRLYNTELSSSQINQIYLNTEP